MRGGGISSYDALFAVAPIHTHTLKLLDNSILCSKSAAAGAAAHIAAPAHINTANTTATQQHSNTATTPGRPRTLHRPPHGASFS
jgi:hypothetical protein